VQEGDNAAQAEHTIEQAGNMEAPNAEGEVALSAEPGEDADQPQEAQEGAPEAVEGAELVPESGDGTDGAPEAQQAEDAAGALNTVPEDEILQPEVPLQPAPPPYVPPDVGDDYVPVAQLPPLPPVHGVNEEGNPVPLPGSESLFLTGKVAVACVLVTVACCAHIVGLWLPYHHDVLLFV
jgi:hypothetical protein